MIHNYCNCLFVITNSKKQFLPISDFKYIKIGSVALVHAWVQHYRNIACTYICNE